MRGPIDDADKTILRVLAATGGEVDEAAAAAAVVVAVGKTGVVRGRGNGARFALAAA